eukprot:8145551-Pyramimonas_sp.AAC.1
MKSASGPSPPAGLAALCRVPRGQRWPNSARRPTPSSRGRARRRSCSATPARAQPGKAAVGS